MPDLFADVDPKSGMAGWAVRRDSKAMGRCSRMDDIIVFGRDGSMAVTKVSDKAFVGKNPVYVAVFDREARIYFSMIYRDGRTGRSMAKRFEVKGVTRDKLYDLTKGTPGSRVLFFAVSKTPEEAPRVVIHLKPVPRLRTKEIEFDFADLAIKGRGVQGNTVTKHAVAKIVHAH